MRTVLVAALVCVVTCGTFGCDPESGGEQDAGLIPGGDGGGVLTERDAGVDAGHDGNGDSDAGTDGGTDTDPDAGPKKWVSGYYVGYQRDLYPPDRVDYAAMTHILIGRVTPNWDGTVDTHFDIDPVKGPAFARDTIQRARQAKTKTLLMVGGAGEYGDWVSAASSANRAQFVSNLVQIVEQFGVDGLDLDWEPIAASDEQTVLQLVKDLKKARPGILLSFPVGWVNTNFPDVTSFYGELAEVVDQLNIMSYDMSGAYPGWSSWHNSALYGEGGTMPSSISSSVNAYVAAGVPKEKLGIGLAFYGQCWTPPVTGPRQDSEGSQIVASDNVMSYTNIMNAYFSADARHWDDVSKVPYLSFSSANGPQGCSFVSYEDAQSITEKGAWVRAQGLGGTIIWTIAQGHLPNAPAGQRDPLLRAVKQAFNP